jgi:hypothetical protein
MLTDGGEYDTKKFIDLYVKPYCVQYVPLVTQERYISILPISAMELSNTLQGIKEINKNVIIINNFEDSNCVKEWTDTTTCDPTTGYLLQSAVVTQERQFCDVDATSRVGTTTCLVDCIKEWTDTKTCDPAGFLLQSAGVTHPALNGGYCDPTTSRIGTTICIPGLACEGSWINSPCDSTGQITQIYNIRVDGNPPCPYIDGDKKNVIDFSCIKPKYLSALSNMLGYSDDFKYSLESSLIGCVIPNIDTVGIDYLNKANDLLNNINESIYLLQSKINNISYAQDKINNINYFYNLLSTINSLVISLTDGGTYDLKKYFDFLLQNKYCPPSESLEYNFARIIYILGYIVADNKIIQDINNANKDIEIIDYINI